MWCYNMEMFILVYTVIRLVTVPVEINRRLQQEESRALLNTYTAYIPGTNIMCTYNNYYTYLGHAGLQVSYIYTFVEKLGL